MRAGAGIAAAASVREAVEAAAEAALADGLKPDSALLFVGGMGYGEDLAARLRRVPAEAERPRDGAQDPRAAGVDRPAPHVLDLELPLAQPPVEPGSDLRFDEARHLR